MFYLVKLLAGLPQSKHLLLIRRRFTLSRKLHKEKNKVRKVFNCEGGCFRTADLHREQLENLDLLSLQKPEELKVLLSQILLQKGASSHRAVINVPDQHSLSPSIQIN